jgi:energy-converting hydrogenase Eha subunit C
MTVGVWLAIAVAVLFGVITVLFALADARIEDERRARRQHPSWPHNTPPRPRRKP